MGSFFSQHKGVIIGVFLAVLVFIGYAMIKPKTDTTSDGLQRTVVDGITTANAPAGDDPAAGFVQQLLAIQNIKFDTAFFSDPVYKELVDQSRPLGVREVGRPNPFLEIGIDTIVNAETSAGRGFVQTSTSTSAVSAPAPATTTRPSTGGSTRTPSR
ncbi:MAG: hypothetical protein RIQ72_170 [Candidatus Parcubacteria bacterium]